MSAAPAILVRDLVKCAAATALAVLACFLPPRLAADTPPVAIPATPSLKALKITIPATVSGLQEDSEHRTGDHFVYTLPGLVFPEASTACDIQEASLRPYTEAVCRYLALGQSGEATRLEEACDAPSAQQMRRHLENPALRERLLAHWAGKQAFLPLVVIRLEERWVLFGHTVAPDGSRRSDFYCLAATPNGLRITTQGELSGSRFNNLALAMADPNARSFITP